LKIGASFWQQCYYDRMPANYHETRNTNPVDLLASGLFGAHLANTLSNTSTAPGFCGLSTRR
jgi:starch synthase